MNPLPIFICTGPESPVEQRLLSCWSEAETQPVSVALQCAVQTRGTVQLDKWRHNPRHLEPAPSSEGATRTFELFPVELQARLGSCSLRTKSCLARSLSYEN